MVNRLIALAYLIAQRTCISICVGRQEPHAEHPAFSVGANFSPDTAEHIAKPMLIIASHRVSQSEPLFTRAF
jgi:hypothetical protein